MSGKREMKEKGTGPGSTNLAHAMLASDVITGRTARLAAAKIEKTAETRERMKAKRIASRNAKRG